MLRRVFSFGPAFSLLLCAATVAVWPRTQKFGDALIYTTESDTAYSIGTAPGHLAVGVTHDLPPMAPEFQDEGFPQTSRGWSASSIRWGTRSRVFPMRTTAGADARKGDKYNIDGAVALG
jgi:hypothetical protein